MKVTDELLIALGYRKMSSSWVDDYHRLYFDQVPETLLELKKIISGSAHNLGVKKGREKALLEIMQEQSGPVNDPVKSY